MTILALNTAVADGGDGGAILAQQTLDSNAVMNNKESCVMVAILIVKKTMVIQWAEHSSCSLDCSLANRLHLCRLCYLHGWIRLWTMRGGKNQKKALNSVCVCGDAYLYKVIHAVDCIDIEELDTLLELSSKSYPCDEHLPILRYWYLYRRRVCYIIMPAIPSNTLEGSWAISEMGYVDRYALR